MKRRKFILGSTTIASGLGFSAISIHQLESTKTEQSIETYVTLDQEKVSFYSDVIKEKIKIIHIADTHLFMDDERGTPFLNFSGRMAKAYNETKHFKTGEKTNPKKAFKQAITFAKESNADIITLVGDIFSFPSELAIEWVLSEIEAIGIPYIYIAGNHDWHYEGMDGSLDSLRDKWIEKLRQRNSTKSIVPKRQKALEKMQANSGASSTPQIVEVNNKKKNLSKVSQKRLFDTKSVNELPDTDLLDSTVAIEGLGFSKDSFIFSKKLTDSLPSINL